MVRLLSTKPDGSQIVSLGITPENIERLKRGNDIVVNLQSFGLALDIEIHVFYTPSAQHTFNQLIKFGMIDENTPTHVDSKMLEATFNTNCICEDDWTDGTGVCQVCHKPRTKKE